MWRNPLEERDDLKSKPTLEQQNDPFGRVQPEPAPDKEIADLSEPAKLGNSVGEQGKNERRDVAKVETMLGKTGSLDLKKTDGPTGYWGMRTNDATRSFQKKHGLKVDGQINPGGETIKTLAKVAGNVLKGLVQKAQGTAQPRPEPEVQQNTNPPTEQQKAESKENQLSAEAFQSNQRAAQYLKRVKGIGDYPRFTTDAINTYGDKAITEIGGLIHQVRANDPGQADELLKRTVQGISPENAQRLSLAAAEERPTQARKERRKTLGERSAETRRDIKEGILRAGAKAGDAVGLDQSSRYLKHFLDGSGKDIVVPRDEARKDPFISESEEKNRKRFENETFLGKTNNDELNEKVRSIKDGETIDLDDKWDRELSFGTIDQPGYTDEFERVLEPDRLLALGSLDFKSKVNAKATRDGDVVRIEGTVTHNGDDKYDFKDNNESFGAYELQQSGRGKPFLVQQNWQQRVSGTVKILGKDSSGRLILGKPQFKWEDID